MRRESIHMQSQVALQVLVGLVGALVCDRNLEDDEIYFLSSWLDKNSDLENMHPANIFISNIKAIVRDKKVSSDEREQFLRMLTKQANQGEQLSIPCMHIDTIKHALNFALTGESRASLKIVTDHSIKGEYVAYWIHAILDKMAGDELNSRYWYRYTNVKYEQYDDPTDELKMIVELLGFNLAEIMSMPKTKQ